MAEQRLYHKIANQILELIDSGIFPPGSRLPGERDLAERFGVSRVAVREAEIALQAQGRLDIKVGSGAYVKEGSEHMAFGLPKVGPFELTEARALFEAEAAALAAPIITENTLRELEDLILVMMGKKVSKMTPDEADEAFHLTIARATNNPAVIYVIQSMWDMRKEASELQRVYRSVCSSDPSHREDEHQDILEALRKRDSSAARVAMRTHFTRMIEALLVVSEKEAYEEVKKRTAESRSRFLLSAQLE